MSNEHTFTAQDAAARANAILRWNQIQREEAEAQAKMIVKENDERQLLMEKLIALGEKQRSMVAAMKRRGFTTGEALSRIQDMGKLKQRRARLRKARGKASEDTYQPPYMRPRDETYLIPVSQREFDHMVAQASNFIAEDPNFTYYVKPSLNKPLINIGELVANLVGRTPSPKKKLSTILEESEEQREEQALSEMMMYNPKDPLLKLMAAEKKLAIVARIEDLNPSKTKKYKKLKTVLQTEVGEAKKKLKKTGNKKNRMKTSRLFAFATGEMIPEKKTGRFDLSPGRGTRPAAAADWYNYPVQKSIDLDSFRIKMVDRTKATRVKNEKLKGEELAMWQRSEWKNRRPRIVPGPGHPFDADLMDDDSDDFITRRTKENRRREILRLLDVAKMKALIGKKPKHTRPTKLYSSPSRRSPARKKRATTPRRTSPRNSRRSTPPSGRSGAARTKSLKSPVSPRIRKTLFYKSPSTKSSSGACGFKVGDVVRKIKGKGKGKEVEITEVKGKKIRGFFKSNRNKCKLQMATNFSK